MIPWITLRSKLAYEARKLFAHVKFEFQRERILHLLELSMPTISIETTNICNANCVFCAYQFQSRPKGVMQDSVFVKVIDEFSDLGGGELSFTPTVGDPLVDPSLVERIKYARSKPNIHKIFMYTNMISLDLIGVNELIKSGINSIMVSTSGFDAEMYKRVYRSAKYKQMLSNVKKFAQANNDAGRPVDFQVDMRVDRPISQVLGYPDYHEVECLIGSEKMGVKFRYDNWSGLIEPGALTGNMKLRRAIPKKRSPCSELYSGPMVYWDGRVGACGCRDINASELIIGDVRDTHLGEIWFGDAIEQLRREFVTDSIKPICRSCTHYNSVAVTLLHEDRIAHINARGNKRRAIRSKQPNV